MTNLAKPALLIGLTVAVVLPVGMFIGTRINPRAATLAGSSESFAPAPRPQVTPERIDQVSGDGNLMSPPTTSVSNSPFVFPTVQPRTDTLSVDQIAAAFVISPSTMRVFGLGPTEVQEMRSNLIHRLKAPHRTINQQTMDDLNSSISALPQNLSPEISKSYPGAERDRINLLVDIAMSVGDDATHQKKVLDDYGTFHSKLCDALVDLLMGSIPAEHKAANQAVVTETVSQIQASLDKQLKIMNGDLLCPAYKWSFDPAQMERLTATVKKWAYVPKYGEDVVAMQLADEAFSRDLKMFAAIFPKIVAFKVANVRINWETVRSPDWSGVTYQMQTASSGWGFTFRLWARPAENRVEQRLHKGD